MPSLAVPTPPVDTTGNAAVRRLLIANRGEIACRIVSTCQKLNITTIAVYTEEDRDSLHVSAADEAVCLGSIKGSKLNPHQDGRLLIRTALAVNADSIHPGYGYLSENAEFAEMVRASNLIFIGPSAHSISVLGDKRQAKEFLMREAPSVPLIPGYSGKTQDLATLYAEADRIGFPILIKAAAGGGGKGMRIVHDRNNLEEELNRAQSEAQRSFGSSDCLLEKYIAWGKHIEVQIVGDSVGHVISLHERECSIQRRHQKIIEEAPCPWLSGGLRERMVASAITIGQLLSYESAGTVEFIVEVESGSFYFLEVNTRIQVEHAITEETTGIDIVALQIYVAAGGHLRDCDVLPTRISQRGHSIECRLCAENPDANFAPSSGLVLRWAPGSQYLKPHDQADVRIESAISTGSTISVYFDSMIAKIVVWAPNRATAIAKMARVLRLTQCIGIKTNHLFLQACLLHPAFRKVDYSTNFIPENLESLLLNPYTGNMDEQYMRLSFVPSLFAQQIAILARDRAATPPFASITPNFRNQIFDTSSVTASVVAVPNPDTAAPKAEIKILVAWPFGRTTRANTYKYKLQIMADIHNDDGSSIATDPKSSLAAVARHFTQCRRQLDEANLEHIKESTVKIIQLRWRREINADAHGWMTAELVLENEGHRLDLFLASQDTGVFQQTFCFDPQLGTAIEYKHYSMLTYSISLRKSLESAQDTDALRQYKATMPCKVLRVVKKKGEKVEKGDVMLVVESMKMETAIIAATSGTFEPKVTEGSAVDVDVLLCEIV
jgi:acetyl/propionyl-CoA carboxylase alpha subunit